MFSWLQFMTRMHMRITVYEIQTSFYNLSSGEVSQSLVMGQCNKIMHFGYNKYGLLAQYSIRIA